MDQIIEEDGKENTFDQIGPSVTNQNKYKKILLNILDIKWRNNEQNGIGHFVENDSQRNGKYSNGNWPTKNGTMSSTKCSSKYQNNHNKCNSIYGRNFVTRSLFGVH
jgi:hypothetical protein